MSQNSDQNHEDKFNALPDIKRCKAYLLIKSDDYELVDCLVARPLCRYSFSFGTHYLCRHPKRQEIIERTEKGQSG